MQTLPVIRTLLAFASVAVLSSLAALPLAAQQGPGGGINPQRDCQTLLTCRYNKGGSYRGCVSSYSCRSCSFVKAKCSIAGRRGDVCRELRCGWGV